MRLPLIGGTQAEEELKSLRAYATEPSHWYRPLDEGRGPGSGTPHRRRLAVKDLLSGQTALLTVVFTFTVASDGSVWRHASIAEAAQSRPPDSVTTFTVCKFLGFDGAPETWQVELMPGAANVVVVVQRVHSSPEITS